MAAIAGRDHRHRRVRPDGRRLGPGAQHDRGDGDLRAGHGRDPMGRIRGVHADHDCGVVGHVHLVAGHADQDLAHQFQSRVAYRADPALSPGAQHMDFGSLPSDLWLGLQACSAVKWVTIFGVQVPILVNIFWCLMGAVIGTAIGVLPGVGPVATMALLLPVTYFLTPEGALIMLAGIYYGAQYGGSTTAILINVPGEASSVVTALDGYAMAKQGRSGPALAIAALGSFFAGTVATCLIVLAAPPLTKLAQQFAPADYFSLMVLGLVLAIVMASGSLLKAFGMIFLGMLLGLVGTDVNTGNTRFTFGIGDLFDGIGFVIVAMGVFGMAEIISNLASTERRDLVSSKVSNLWPTQEDMRRSFAPILRGTVLGSLLGVLPGGGA